MKRLFVIALAMFVAISCACPGSAQRSVAHGGFSAHAAPAFRGGLAASAPPNFTGAPRYTGSGSSNLTSRFLGSAPRNFASRSNYYYGPARYHRPYPSRFGHGVPYLGVGWIAPVYLNSGYLDSGDPGYPDTTAYDNSQGPQNSAEYENPPPDQAPPTTAPPYPSYIQPPPTPSSAPAEEDAVTLIFRDGRPPEQIHNYVMTRTTLYVRDQHHRDIPLDQLDLTATQKVNQTAGIDFQLPTLSR